MFLLPNPPIVRRLLSASNHRFGSFTASGARAFHVRFGLLSPAFPYQTRQGEDQKGDSHYAGITRELCAHAFFASHRAEEIHFTISVRSWGLKMKREPIMAFT